MNKPKRESLSFSMDDPESLGDILQTLANQSAVGGQVGEILLAICLTIRASPPMVFISPHLLRVSMETLVGLKPNPLATMCLHALNGEIDTLGDALKLPLIINTVTKTKGEESEN